MPKLICPYATREHFNESFNGSVRLVRLGEAARSISIVTSRQPCACPPSNWLHTCTACVAMTAAVAAAVLRDVAMEVDALLSNGQRTVHLEELGCLYRLAQLQYDNDEIICAPDVVRDTRLAYKLGALLLRILEQYRERTGWQNLSYCKMVREAAKAVTFSLGMSASSVRGASNQRLDSVQQLAASGLLPKLAATLPGLTAAVETASKGRACVRTAVTVLSSALCIISACPGQAGMLSSRAAGPLVLPTLDLAVTVIQHVVAASEADSFDVVAGSLVVVQSNLTRHVPQPADRPPTNQQQQQQQQQDYPYLRSLVRSPAYLTLLLTIGCMMTHSDAAVADLISTPTIATATATARSTGSAGRTARATSNHSQHTAAAARAPRSHSRATAAGGTVSEAATARQQQLQLHKQLAQLLQTLYGRASTASNWEILLSGSKVVSRLCWSSATHAHEILTAAAECLSQGIMEHKGDVSLQQQQRQFLEAHSNNLRALCQLPVLLLQGMCSAAAAAAPAARSAAAYEVINAALTLITRIVCCWQSQVKLKSSHVSIQLQQLPCAELLQLLLQEMDALLQLRSEAAAVLTAAQPAAAAGGGSSSRAATNTAAANRRQHGGSAAAAATHDVTLLDSCMMQLLEILRVLQTVSHHAIWQPHGTHLAAAVEHCLRSISSNPNAVSPTVSFNLCMCSSFLWHQKFKFADTEGGA